jgi:hypothetical protein
MARVSGAVARGRGCVPGVCAGYAASSRAFPPAGGGLAGGFMIVGQKWLYPPKMTYDHGRRRFLRAAGVPGMRTREQWPFGLRPDCGAGQRAGD